MIVIITDNNNKSYFLLKKLLSYCLVLIIPFKCFNIKQLINCNIYTFVFCFNKLSAEKCNLIEKCSKFYPKTPMFFISFKKNSRLSDMQNLKLISISSYDTIIETINNIISNELYGDKKIEKIKEYISSNICSINSVIQISKKFNIDQRKLSLEFKYNEGISIKSYINEVRFNLLKNTLYRTKEIGNYYAIARNCGLYDDRNLYHIIKKKTGKTPLEYHKKLLKLDKYKKSCNVSKSV